MLILAASQSFKNAVNFNAQKCEAALTTSGKLEKPKGSQEYAWLLNNKLSELEKKKLFSKLISDASPSGTPQELLGVAYAEDPFSLELSQRTGIPEVKDGRYGIASDCIPHSCALRGILWVDVKEGTSVAGFVESTPSLSITSKFYHANTIPFQAKQDIKKVVSEIYSVQFSLDPAAIATSEINFYDIETKKRERLTFSWLDERT